MAAEAAMIPVLDGVRMREADRITIADLGVPGLVLMERAAAGVTEAMLTRFGDADRIVIVCGSGNNGGDGLAVARQLRCHGFAVDAALVVSAAELRGDAAKQLELARAFGVPVHDCSGELTPLSDLLAAGAVVVDALFGTGLDRPLDGRLLDVVRLVNNAGLPVVAIDIPSGLQASLATPAGESIAAALTVTFAAPKVAHVLPPACYRCGDVAVAEIGIPPWVLDDQALLGLLEAEDVSGWLPQRAPDAHKGRFGHLVIVAGREGRAGAAALGARAGVTLGAGLVTVATARGAVAPIQALVPEAMVDPLPQGDDGAVTGAGIEASLAKATAVAVGPGLGLGDGPRRLVVAILENWQGPLLLDADALTLLSGGLDRLQRRKAPTVLTPHPGELARLLGVGIAEVAADRLHAAQRAAEISGAVVLAKGARSLVVERGALPLVNPTGTPGLASGGAGDVLSGCVGALLAQGLSGREAAATGAWLHGRAAELAGERFAGAVPAGSVAERLADAEAELRALA
jgi:NAD(P)H-hydrate epimerase